LANPDVKQVVENFGILSATESAFPNQIVFWYLDYCIDLDQSYSTASCV